MVLPTVATTINQKGLKSKANKPVKTTSDPKGINVAAKSAATNIPIYPNSIKFTLAKLNEIRTKILRANTNRVLELLNVNWGE